MFFFFPNQKGSHPFSWKALFGNCWAPRWSAVGREIRQKGTVSRDHVPLELSWTAILCTMEEAVRSQETSERKPRHPKSSRCWDQGRLLHRRREPGLSPRDGSWKWHSGWSRGRLTLKRQNFICDIWKTVFMVSRKNQHRCEHLYLQEYFYKLKRNFYKLKRKFYQINFCLSLN